jgi:hypothetical protein
MTSVEATIAGLQGKKVRYVGWPSGRYLEYRQPTREGECAWYDNLGNFWRAPYLMFDYKDWELHVEPLKIEIGKRYIAKYNRTVMVVGKSCSGKWVVQQFGASNAFYEITDDFLLEECGSI